MMRESEWETHYYRPLVVVVGEEDAGKQVRTVLERRLGVSRKLLSQIKLTDHGLTVNEQRVYVSALVQCGDVIRVRMERERSEDIKPQPLPLSIVYEDEDLLIVNKPAGMIVHPTHGHYLHTLANGVVHHWEQAAEQVRFRPIHRLDEYTSGLVAIAKTSYVHQQLSEQLQSGMVDKTYRAYVYGLPKPTSGTIDAPIDRKADEPHIRAVVQGGYDSITHYQTLRSRPAEANTPAAACVRLRLETGRTHQIRVHMQHIGCPLLGDSMYGLQESEGAVAAWEAPIEGRQALHAEILSFTHPITKERVTFVAPLPPDLLELEQILFEDKKKEKEDAKMEMIVYQYPKCSTCRNAVKSLKEKGHTPELVHIAEQPPQKEELRAIVAKSGLPLKKFFNTSGDVYKRLGLKDKLGELSEDEQLELLAGDGMLIKRPIVVQGDKVTVGYKEETYQQIWGVNHEA